MFCSKCGNKLSDDAVFCSKCGFRLGGIVGEEEGVLEQPKTVLKSKKDFIYDSFCMYMTLQPLIVGACPTFGELENYEEGAGGMVYCELVATSRNMLGKTKKTRFGAVIQEVEADGNVVFKGAGPQLMTPITTTKILKKLCGFKK